MVSLSTGIALLLGSSFDLCLLPSFIYGICSKSKTKIIFFGLANALFCLIILNYLKNTPTLGIYIFFKLAAGICVGFLGHALPSIWGGKDPQIKNLEIKDAQRISPPLACKKNDIEKKQRALQNEHYSLKEIYKPKTELQEPKIKKELPPLLKKYRLLGLFLTVIFCVYGLSVDIDHRRTLFEIWVHALGFRYQVAPILAASILVLGWFLRSFIGTFFTSIFLRLFIILSNFYKKI